MQWEDWVSWCSGSLHNLVQSQREAGTVSMVVPAVLCVILVQGHGFVKVGKMALDLGVVLWDFPLQNISRNSQLPQ